MLELAAQGKATAEPLGDSTLWLPWPAIGTPDHETTARFNRISAN
jgi:hypothetical protein